MILWFVGPSCLAVWAVFRDPRLDFRFVAAGALLPDAVDAVAGKPEYGHTLVVAAGTLLLVVAATSGRRTARARLVMIPVGMLLHLILAGAFSRPDVFWWPSKGLGFPAGDLVPSAGGIAWRETVGLASCAWFAWRFGLTDRARLRRFVRSGRVEVPVG